MSRLFCIVKSDGRKRPERITVHERASVELMWGSTRRSKQLMKIEVDWDREKDMPTIKIKTDEDVNVKWNTTESIERNKRGTGGYSRR